MSNNGQRYIQDVVIRQAPLKENRYVTRMYLHDVNLVKIENGIQSFTNPALGLQGVRPIESLNQNIADSQDNSSGSTQFSRQLNDAATHTSDSDGRQLAPQQQEYFKNSKVRDENGNLKVMYHGTPTGGFTEFRNGLQFFTENKDYADNYQEPTASSRKAGKPKTNPQTYEVYLNITNPFDIRDPKIKDIFINEFDEGRNSEGCQTYHPPSKS